MVAAGIDDYTIMELVGHITKKMLERYTHPTNARKVDALETFSENLDGQNLGRTENDDGKSWWTAGGSNSRPPRCERGALPTELAAHRKNEIVPRGFYSSQRGLAAIVGSRELDNATRRADGRR
jgi:hypothetical protein